MPQPPRHRFGYRAGLLLFLTGILLGLLLAGIRVGTPPGRSAQSTAPADLIVVLGGGHGARTRRGAELYAAGKAERVLVTGVYAGDIRAGRLEKAGVPAGALILNGTAVNTWQEAHFLRLLMLNNGWERALVITDPPHLARVRWSLGQAFAGTDLGFQLVSSEPSWWHAEHWWTDPIALSFVASEVVKGVYYRLRYGLLGGLLGA